MKKRIPLKSNTELRFKNHVNGDLLFIVKEVLGVGGSCIVYDGYYIINAGTKTTVRIKECYPYKLHLQRGDDNGLLVPENEENSFCEYKKRVEKSFEIANDLHESSGLNNFTSNMYDIYHANNTVYIVSSYVEGSTLAQAGVDSLAGAVRIALSVARCIDRMHKKGFLYLDIKPENIFVFKETYDIIQLFDFDSVIPIGCEEEISEYKMSYSMGFAPLEQKRGAMSRIGPHTDVYSVGALLFYMMFGKAPGPLDCGFDAEYDYSKLVCGSSHQNKVYKELTAFFRKTLQPYVPDRYQDMSAAVEQLEVIHKYADLPVPFICSTYVTNEGSVIGRQEECNKLEKWLHSAGNVYFVSGLGGVGKSTIVRKFVSENRDEIDNVIYLKYKETLSDTIADDMQFCISGLEREEEESAKEYFRRKLKAAKELSVDNSNLLVIDNFSGELTDEFSALLTLNWKMIFITRSDMSKSSYPCLKVEGLNSTDELRALFENNMGYKLAQEDYRKFGRMVEKVQRHTLILTLIAKQIANSYLTFKEALELVENNGFSEMAPERVDYIQDGERFYSKISDIIKAVCDTSSLSEIERNVLKIISVHGGMGIDVKEIKALLELETFDEINHLKDSGWIEISNDRIEMHPLILETINQTEWTSECRQIAITKMQELFKLIMINGKCEDYPKKLHDRNEKIKRKMEKSDFADAVIQKMLAKRGYVGETTLERILQNDEHKLDDRRFHYVLEISKAVLDSCGHDNALSEENVFKDLLFQTLINLPKDQETYIIRKAEGLFDDQACQNPYAMMELYDYVVYLLCQKEDYASVDRYLGKAKAYAKSQKSDYVWGLFYDMQNDYYEALLDGAYYTQDEEEQELLGLLTESTKQSMKYMKKSRHESAKLKYVKYTLGFAALLIRSVPEEWKRIKKMIQSVVPLMEENALPYAEVRSVYHLVCAWYYTLCVPDCDELIAHLETVEEIDNHRKVSALDRIDYFYIPAANMLNELELVEDSVKFLEVACDICDRHKDSAPYIRKKRDLLSYQLQIFEFEEDLENKQRILRLIDEVNLEAAEYDIKPLVV